MGVPLSRRREKEMTDEVPAKEDVADGRGIGCVGIVSGESVRWGQKEQQKSAALYLRRLDSQRLTNDPHSQRSWG